MATDMSLGGGAGFAAGYTPIRFAPLVSLTGSVVAPATPVTPEQQVPQMALPMMYDMSGYGQGGDDTPQRSDEAFQNLQPIGHESRAAELAAIQNAAKVASAITNPLGFLAAQTISNVMGGSKTNPFSSFMQSLQNFARGGQAGPSVSLPYEGGSLLSRDGGSISSAVINDVYESVAPTMGGQIASDAAAVAAGLVAQGVSPAQAVAHAQHYAGLAAMYGGGGGKTTPTPNLDALNQTLESFNQSAGGGYSGDFGGFGEASGATGGWV